MHQRGLLSIVLLCAAALVHAQAVDTVGVSRDTTLIRTAEPFPIDTTAIPAGPNGGPADTSATGATLSPTADTLATDTVASKENLTWRERHSPRTATILSAIVPGAGQIYNRKYWKAPIVWAGLGLSYAFIRDNTQEYKRYRTAYLALVDDDPSTIDEFNGQHSPEQVRQVMETYQRWRDISYIAIAGVYILNIIDASVDAHFVRFDVSPDLSLNIGPSLYASSVGALGVSVQLKVRR